jgi:hypothetical protein
MMIMMTLMIEFDKRLRPVLEVMPNRQQPVRRVTKVGAILAIDRIVQVEQAGGKGEWGMYKSEAFSSCWYCCRRPYHSTWNRFARWQFLAGPAAALRPSPRTIRSWRAVAAIAWSLVGLAAVVVVSCVCCSGRQCCCGLGLGR